MFIEPHVDYALSPEIATYRRMAFGQADKVASGAHRSGQRLLPSVVAAAVLMTADYAGAETPGVGSASVSGYLPAHLCLFDGVAWHDDWTGDRDGVWMTPLGGQRVRFAPPAGFRELCQATALLAAELSPEIRRLILLAHPDLDPGTVVEGHVVAPVLAEFAGRYHALVSEVWLELHDVAATAHGRIHLAQERRDLETDDAD